MPLVRALQKLRFSEKGPLPQVLHLSDAFAVMLLCLQSGQALRAPESDAAETIFCVLAGDGFIEEGGERHPVSVGDVVIIPTATTKALIASEGTMSVLGVRHLGRRRA